jgi:hypothetical protein
MENYASSPVGSNRDPLRPLWDILPDKLAHAFDPAGHGDLKGWQEVLAVFP